MGKIKTNVGIFYSSYFPFLFLFIVERFEEFISTSLACSAVSVSRTQLQSVKPSGFEATSDEISELISSGFLTIQDPENFWISVRGAGKHASQFSKGKQEIMAMLRRRKTGETFQHVIFR